MKSPTPQFPTLTPAKRAILFLVMALSTNMLVLQDMGLMNALTTIRSDLHLSTATMQWLITLYLVSAAIVIVPGGRYSDYYGRFNIFITYLILFIIGTILCSIGTNLWLLVIGRVIVGFSSGSLAISAAILNSAYPTQQRHYALVLWNGSLMLTNALAPFLAGLFTQYANWRLLFWISLGIDAVCLLLALWLRREEIVEPKKIPIDYLGCVLLALALVLFVLIFSEGAEWGWTSPAIIVFYAACPLFFVSFFYWETKAKVPLVPYRLFVIPSFLIASCIIFLVQMAWTPMAYLYLQYAASIFGLQYSVLFSGVSFIPFAIVAFFIAVFSNKILKLLKMETEITLGCAALFAGLLLMSFIAASTTYLNIWWRLVLCGLGVAFPWMLTLPIALSEMPVKQSGLATGAFEIFRYVGMVAGIGIMSSVSLTTIATHTQHIADKLTLTHHSLRDIIYLGHANPAWANQQLQTQPLSATAQQSMQQIFTHGFQASMLGCMICAAVALGAMLAYAVFVKISKKS